MTAAAAEGGTAARRWPGLLASGLALLQAALLLHTAVDKSDTIDEPHYLATALVQSRLDFAENCDAPALPKWGFAATLRVADP